MTSQMETTRVLSGGVASWTGAGHWKSSVPWSACGWIQNSFRILWWCCNTICTYTHLYMYTVHIKSVYTHRCPHVYRSYMLHAYAYTNIHHDIYAKKTYLLYIYIWREYASGLLMFTSWFDGFHCLLFVCFTGCPTGPGVSKSPLSRMASPVSTGGC